MATQQAVRGSWLPDVAWSGWLSPSPVTATEPRRDLAVAPESATPTP